MTLTCAWLLLLSTVFATRVSSDLENISEMRFKFWLQPGFDECYHEPLEAGASDYFMYEILNTDEHDSSIVALFRNAENGSIVAMPTTPQRGHLEFKAEQSTLIDICLSHTYSDIYAKLISVFFHVYHVERLLASVKEVEAFDNSSIGAHKAINSIGYHIFKSRENQIEVEMLNEKDSYLLQQTFSWINRWALIHHVLIIGCSLFQTFFIKRLFQTTPGRMTKSNVFQRS